MEIITILLLLLLLLAGLLNIYLYIFPSKILYAWLQSFSFKKNPSVTAKVAPQLPPKEKKSGNSKRKGELKSVFATFDKNGDGFITEQELRESLKNIGILMTEKEVGEMVVKVDSNGDGLIDFEEFCILCESMGVVGGGGCEEDEEGESSGENGGEEEGDGVEGGLKEAFEVFDKDKDGLISVEELGLVLNSLGLKEGKRVEDCKEMIRKVDMDGDGMVNFDEFKKMMRTGSKLISAF